jgi:uncharacterized protein
MEWSKFNYLYFSKKHNKHLLYNSLSNAFIELNNPTLIELINNIKENNSTEILSEYPDLLIELKQSKIIVESDETEILKIKHKLLTNRYSSNTVIFTLLPTLACNYECPYCFAKTDGESITPEVSNSIVKLLERLISNNKSTLLNLSWMGGEPLLNFEAIQSLTNRLKRPDIHINAHLVTNGYLMTKEKIEQFKELYITFVQVTVDGLEEEHNLTRVHKQGKNTFAKIIENLTTFFSIYNQENSIALNLRVNLDRTKNYLKKFIDVYLFFKHKYPYQNLYISPGFIGDIKANGFKTNCEFDRTSVQSFLKEIVNAGLLEYSLYPENNIHECAVRSQTDFVIGPKGEIYSCWENIGHEEFIIGHLNAEGIPEVKNETFYYRYLAGADYLNDDTCLNCFFFPLCTGGCPEKRIRNKYCKAKFDNCMVQKDDMKNILDLHFEVKQKINEMNKKNEPVAT